MKILMVTSEATPFAKSGGLADAVSALSRALAKAGHDLRVFLPRYYSIDRAGLEPFGETMAVPTAHGEEWTSLYRSVLPGSSVPVYFLDHEAVEARLARMK